MGFSRDDWAGSFYDLSIDLGKDEGRDRIVKAVQAVFRSPAVSGPWSSREDVCLPERRLPAPTCIPSDDIPSYTATVTLPAGQVVGVVVCTVICKETSSLDICIPLGMLARVFPLVYPLDLATDHWLAQVDEALIELAEAVHTEVPFDLALIGEEAAGYATVDTLKTSDVERGGVLVSPSISDGLQPARNPTVTAMGLHWYSLIGPHITFGGSLPARQQGLVRSE